MTDETAAPGERHASWLELFFDLTVVAAAAQIAHRLDRADSIGRVAACAALFYAIWSVWTTTSVYANVAGERTRQRSVLMTMLGIAVMASAAPGVWPELLPGEHAESPEGRTAVFVVAFLLCRSIAARSAARDGQIIAFWPATQSVLALPWVISLFVPRPVAYGLWAFAIVADLAFSMIGARSGRWVEGMTDQARQRQQQDERRRLGRLLRRGGGPETMGPPRSTPISVARVARGHLDERLGLFVIIVLGEALAQVVTADSAQVWTPLVVASSLAGFVLLITLWRLTSLYGFTPAPRRTAALEPSEALPAHLGVTASIVAIAAGFGGLLPVAAEHLHTKDRWFLFGGLLLYIVTSVAAALAGRAPLRWYLGWAGPCLVVLAVLAIAGEPLPAWSLALAATAVLGWFATYNRLTDARRADGGV